MLKLKLIYKFKLTSKLKLIVKFELMVIIRAVTSLELIEENEADAIMKLIQESTEVDMFVELIALKITIVNRIDCIFIFNVIPRC